MSNCLLNNDARLLYMKVQKLTKLRHILCSCRDLHLILKQIVIISNGPLPNLETTKDDGDPVM